MRKINPISISFLAIFVIALGCDAPSPSPAGDARGDEAPATSNQALETPPPRKVVSLVPSVTEIVFDMGLGDRIVGVSDFAQHPPEVAKIEKLGGLLNPNLERLTALQPDLVLVHASGDKVREHTEKLGIRSLTVPSENLEDVEAAYIKIGVALQEPELGESRAKALMAALEEVSVKERADAPTVLLVVGRNPGTLEGMIGVGPGAFLDQLLIRAGGKNALPDTKNHWPQVNKEILLTANPDVIIELSPGADGDPAKQKEKLEPWEALSSLSAVKNNKVYILNGPHLLIPGPRLVQTTKDLAERLR